MYLLSHGCLLSSYKAFFHLHTWLCMSCDFTSSGCNCLFVFYVFFVWEASCYEYFLLSHDVSVYYMLDHVDPYGRHYILPFKSQYRILDIILLEWLVLLDHTLLRFILVFFFRAGRICINDVAQQCHITALCLRPLLSLKVSSYYSSSWIISRTVVTCSSKQVSSFFSCRWLYAIFPTNQMH